MANRQTRSLRKKGYGTKVIKGASDGLSFHHLDIFKGKPCVTDFKNKDQNPMNKRKSPKRYVVFKGKDDE